MTDTRRRTCVHEAGHAVADVVLGRPVEYVSIRPGQTFSGIEVSVPHPFTDADRLALDGVTQQPPALRADVERKVIVLLAGELAARHLGPRTEDGYRTEIEDEIIARQALDQLGPRLAELVVAQEASDEALVRDEEKALELAEALTPEAGATFYLEWLRFEAQALVLRYQGAILRVADALERHAVLRGDQIAALVYPPPSKEIPHATP